MLGGSIGPLELLVLVVLGLFLFGPERLPGVVRDVARAIRKFREMAADVTNDLKEELGPELADLDLREMHPKAIVRKHLLEPAYEATDKLGLSEALEDSGLRRPVPASGSVQPRKPATPATFDDAT